ncbi:amidohydrolase family protein [Variovorax sp. VNK109]|uniref:amidohydrolase family protein n=1 Tax=Variovorax sp. VNK109 TaxID=3400919 RepID=UPI003C09A092
MRDAGRIGTIVSVNTSSNLRLRSGIAPVQDMHSSGVKFAVGMDALALDDDDDLLREVRLIRLLHAALGFEERIPRETFLDAATRIGAAACGCVHGGQVAEGMPADLLLLDLDREGQGTSLATIPTVLHVRATAACTKTLVIDGRVIFDEGKVTGIDEPATARELMSQLRAHEHGVARFLPLVHDYQQLVATHFKEGRHVAGAT